MQNLNRETINRVFRRDFEKLLGFDIFEMCDDLERLKHSSWYSQFTIGAVLVPQMQLGTNISEIVDNFLRYDPERFEAPLEQYTFIYESKNIILDLLERNLTGENAFDDPVAFSYRKRLIKRFERFFAYLLSMGNSHRFIEEEIENRILGESYGMETD